jgi:PPOX class probable F420-dependent enzyme
MELSRHTIDLATQPNYGFVATRLPSGAIQNHPIWVDTDGEHILLNTEIHRRKTKNVEDDPRVTVTILHRDDPWNWSEIRGEVVEFVRGQEARDHIDAMAKKYLGKDTYPNPIQTERVILKVAPHRVIERGA